MVSFSADLACHVNNARGKAKQRLRDGVASLLYLKTRRYECRGIHCRPIAARSPKCSLNGRHQMPPKLWKPILQSVRNTMDVLHLNETLPISPQKKGLIPPVVQLYTNKFFGLENRKKCYFEMWRKTPFPREGSTKSINFKKTPGLIPNKVCIFWCGTKHGSHWFYFFLHHKSRINKIVFLT